MPVRPISPVRSRSVPVLPPLGAAGLRTRLALLVLFSMLVLVAVDAGAKARWEPIAPADLAATDSTSRPGADAEILFSRYTTNEDAWGTESVSHVRAKIYTAKGVEDQGKLSIYYSGTTRPRGVVARVVKPDGTDIELQAADMFDTTVVKFGGSKLKTLSFIFPNLAPGDIVEFKWSLTESRFSSLIWRYAQQEIPIREFRFTSVSSIGENFVSWVNCPDAEESRALGLVVTVKNLPAFEPEDFMPPQREFRGWVFKIRSFNERDHEEMWKKINFYTAENFNELSKPGATISAKARALVTGATSDEEKLALLHEFCQAAIGNLSYITTPEAQRESEKSRGKTEQWAATTLKRKFGFSNDIDTLFAALARASGFTVRLVLNPSRDDLLNLKTPRGWAFMERSHIAVKVGDGWRHYAPGNPFLPPATLDWRDEGAEALLAEETRKQVTYITNPVSPASSSRTVRIARLTLEPDGTLEGDIEETYTGQVALLRKAQNWDSSGDEVDRDFRSEVNERLRDAEVTGLDWTNLRNATMPLVARYHVRIPGYVEQAGARLVLRPAFFQAGRTALFTAEKRVYPIMFPYAWQESDRVEIVLPEGYALDQPSAPAPAGNPAGDIGASYDIRFSRKTRTLTFSREFVVGADGVTAFVPESYPVLKERFEAIHRSDNHAIILKPKAPAPEPDGAPASGTTSAAGGSS